MNYEEAINTQYGMEDIIGKILSRFKDEEIDTIEKVQKVLAPVQELHLRGRQVTLELAINAGVNEKMRILDVGSGIGGPARTLASEFGCKVTGLDLCEEYCRTAEKINEMVGFGDLIEIRQGNALNMPFEDDYFDVVFLQHVLMNIENKEDVLSQINRVLHPKGRLAFNTICAGSVIPIYFPVIWANNPEISYLIRANELRKLIRDCGFRKISWIDDTKNIIKEIQSKRVKPRSNKPQSIKLDLIIEDPSTKWRNIVQNLKESRIVVIQGIFEKLS